MGNELRYWNRYWQGKRDPEHGCVSPQQYDKYAQELRVLFRNSGYEHILELGCGTGVFYELLGFDRADYYKGIDWSESMLEEFSRTHHGVVLQRASAQDYLDDKKYDLIYSNGVMQCLDADNLRRHFTNAEKMLSDDGEIIDASLPWKIHRRAYAMRKIRPPYTSLSTVALKSTIVWLMNRFKIGRDSLGYWYTPSQIAKIAMEFGLKGEFYGSMCYPYRFHVVLRRT